MAGLMLVHVGHLVMVHRRRRLNRVLLMVLVADRRLLDRWRINHVGHGCVFPLFLALQERRDVERRFRVIDNVIIEFIISWCSHDCCEGNRNGNKKRKALYSDFFERKRHKKKMALLVCGSEAERKRKKKRLKEGEREKAKQERWCFAMVVNGSGWIR